jgi:WD40 repeat protein
MWNAHTLEPLRTLAGHRSLVFGVALSADGAVGVSGSADGTVRLWKTADGALLRTLRVDRRSERLDITGLSGVTEAQRRTLLALGAVDRRGTRHPAPECRRSSVN